MASSKHSTDTKIVKKNIEICGNLQVDGCFLTPSKEHYFQPSTLIVKETRDLLCQTIFSNFIPILIPGGSTITELSLLTCEFFNRQIYILNLSGRNIRIDVPFGQEIHSATLPTGSHANVTILFEPTTKTAYGTVDISTTSARPGFGAPPPPTGGDQFCSFNYNLSSGQTLDSVTSDLARYVDLSLPPPPEGPGIGTQIIGGGSARTIIVTITPGNRPTYYGTIIVTQTSSTRIVILGNTGAVCSLIFGFPGTNLVGIR